MRRTIRTGPGLLALFGALLCMLASSSAQRPAADFEALPFAPRRYVAYRAPSALALDGKLNEPAWTAAAWSELFVDIEGDSRPQPGFRTRMKMLWDDESFYVAAEMEEPDLWGTLTARDSVIFHDNDFEVFIDPDGDTNAYYELEVNALGTPWDLMLLKPYSDGGRAIDAWDIAGLKAGTYYKWTIVRVGADLQVGVRLRQVGRAVHSFAKWTGPPLRSASGWPQSSAPSCSSSACRSRTG